VLLLASARSPSIWAIAGCHLPAAEALALTSPPLHFARPLHGHRTILTYTLND
jgi:hypothetical protein